MRHPPHRSTRLPSSRSPRPLTCSVLIAGLVLARIVHPATPSETGTSAPPGTYRLFHPGKEISFPFEVYRGDIRFRAEVNSHPVHLLLDDGFMWDPLLFWGGPEADALGLAIDGVTSIAEAEDDDALRATTASAITLVLPGVEFLDQTAVITPASSGTSAMWAGSVGQVSATLFKHFVVDINFDTMMITLIPPQDFVYRGNGTAIPWRPMAIGAWSVPGTFTLEDGRARTLELMLDLGYNDQAQIATGGEHGFTTPTRAVPASLGFNIQGEETRGHVGRVPSIEIGGYELKNVIAGFVVKEQLDSTFHEVMIGLGLLSRFNLVFDASRHRLFVEANEAFDEPYEWNMSGLSMRKSPKGVFEVTDVLPRSPGEEAGLRVGDVIVTIDGQAAADLDRWSLTPLLERDGTVVELVVVRSGKKVAVPVTLRRLL
jgi:hypothetical protein